MDTGCLKMIHFSIVNIFVNLQQNTKYIIGYVIILKLDMEIDHIIIITYPMIYFVLLTPCKGLYVLCVYVFACSV